MGSRPLRVESLQAQGGRHELCQPAGTSPPPALVGRSRGSFAGLDIGHGSAQAAGRSGVGGGPSQGRHFDSVFPPRVVPGGRGLRLGRGFFRLAAPGGSGAGKARAPSSLPLERVGPPGRRSPPGTRSSLPGSPAAADRSASQGCARVRAGPCAYGCCVLGGSRGL
ncbi:hypothetical protein NDU88_000673 [Pleurodeles waltl]|uniref:Uncharacterized protein n=1 Tax=Pleurodeles waltl TaxID=8319 RepID=A0AAV7S5V7_PLEWA|nr:hypothetical protein NDU88_000673 [Pleurodeles waltl]